MSLQGRNSGSDVSGAVRLAMLVAVVTPVFLIPSIAVAATGVGQESQGSSPRPGVLWDAFPLGQPRSPFTPPVASVSPPIASPALSPGASAPAVIVRPADDRTPLVPIVAVLALVVVLSGIALLAVRGPARSWNSVVAPLRSRAGTGEPAYVMVLPGRFGRGERVFERAGKPPELGEVIYDSALGQEGQGFVVELVGPSPFPGDSRPCAFLLPL